MRDKAIGLRIYTQFFKSRTLRTVGGVHWRCVTKRSVSGFTPDFSSHAPYGLLAVYIGGA
ncbi:hypothetical protein CKA32_004500 [Geitlerinema sp. FC II]|nr:hypothetical protein CKA32_004500 [Geitlerinema sp. FC II]